MLGCLQHSQEERSLGGWEPIQTHWPGSGGVRSRHPCKTGFVVTEQALPGSKKQDRHFPEPPSSFEVTWRHQHMLGGMLELRPALPPCQTLTPSPPPLQGAAHPGPGCVPAAVSGHAGSGRRGGPGQRPGGVGRQPPGPGRRRPAGEREAPAGEREAAAGAGELCREGEPHPEGEGTVAAPARGDARPAAVKIQPL